MTPPRKPFVPADREWDEPTLPGLSLRQRVTDGLLAIAGLAVLSVALIVGSVVFFRFLDNSEARSGWVEIHDLEVGQCFDVDPTAPDDGIMPDVRLADCSTGHYGELIGRFEYDLPDTGDLLDYPGLDSLFAYASPRCASIALSYTGLDPGDAKFEVTPLIPLRSAWMQRATGGRQFHCIAEPADGGLLSGSVKAP